MENIGILKEENIVWNVLRSGVVTQSNWKKETIQIV
jgi:hypothetical protein